MLIVSLLSKCEKNEHASRAVGHRRGYLECVHHVEEAFGQEFDISHCLVTDQEDVALALAEGFYDHLSLLVMDLVAEALKHDDWCARLKTILDPPQTVELSDEEETADGDGDGDEDGEGGGDEQSRFLEYEICVCLLFVVTIIALLLETLVKLARINVSVARV
ncbi:hypothetical protein Hanom_Chr11g01016331 [Helianthus anomalus]